MILQYLRGLIRFSASLLFVSSITMNASGVISDVWNPATFDNHAKLQDNRLILTPADKAWGRVIVFGKNPVHFWSRDGVTLSLRLTLDTTIPGEKSDTTTLIGFTSSDKASTIQAADNFVGISLTCDSRNGLLYASLVRKEVNAKDGRIRGDQWGSVVAYRGVSEATVGRHGKSVDVTFTLTENTVSATIDGSSYSEKFPSGLTKEFWRKAFLTAQCSNRNDGRGTATIENVIIHSADADTSMILPIDLRAFANRGFKDDAVGEGGWTGQGSNDLRHIETGHQLIHSLPFDIIKPESNNGKSCLVLYGSHNEFFPKELGPVPIGKKADSLVFLHSAGWTKSRELVARYRVKYASGKSLDIPIVAGAQINDWWSMEDVSDPNAAIFLEVRSEQSATGLVGIYGFRWENPAPDQTIESVSFLSVGGEPTVGILAASLVPAGIGKDVESALKNSFERDQVVDFKKHPPDAKEIPDQVTLKVAKTLGADAFSVAGNYSGGRGGEGTLKQGGYADLIQTYGGISRFPYGLEIGFYFWPYLAKDWYSVLGEKGGTYGAIPKWYYKGTKVNDTLSYQTMLAAYKKLGLKLILMFNCHAMFNGKDFIYLKTLPEDKMKRLNPLDSGSFNKANLKAIVENNSTLVDYIVKNGYEDTIAYWEMDNERWDMPGNEYAETVAAHVTMLRSKLPNAKVIVCLGELSSYSVNPSGTHAFVWSKELLGRLKELGMNDQIDCFAPHIYPYLSDKVGEIMQNYLEDYNVRNTYRSLDLLSGLLDSYGFEKSRFYLSEWAAQSDGLGDGSRNDLLTSMASAIATTKEMMSIYSHPRVEGATWHQFLHASTVSKERKSPLSRWGVQSIFITESGRYITTPPSEAVKMFIQFAKGAKLVPEKLSLPKGIHCLCANAENGKRHFVVNSTATEFVFPVKPIGKRSSLFADSVTATSIRKYGTYGDNEDEVKEIKPRDFNDFILPPYSISILRSPFDSTRQSANKPPARTASVQ